MFKEIPTRIIDALTKTSETDRRFWKLVGVLPANQDASRSLQVRIQGIEWELERHLVSSPDRRFLGEDDARNLETEATELYELADQYQIPPYPTDQS